MANTLKKSAASLKAIATGDKAQEQQEVTTSSPGDAPVGQPKQKRKTVMIGGHFNPAARRSLALLQADPRNEGKQVIDLLAEALNDIFAKYGVPQTATLD